MVIIDKMDINILINLHKENAKKLLIGHLRYLLLLSIQVMHEKVRMFLNKC